MKLSDLLHQASKLTTTNTGRLKRSVDYPDDVVLTEKELEARERQLTAQPGVMIQAISTQQQEELQVAQHGKDAPDSRAEADKLIFVSDRTKQWVRDNV